jgi:hypothetical protein
MFCGGSSAVAGQLATGALHATSSRVAFAAFKANNKLVVWGYASWGGNASEVSAKFWSGVIGVAHTITASAALKDDGTVVTLGQAEAGGDRTS